MLFLSNAADVHLIGPLKILQMRLSSLVKLITNHIHTKTITCDERSKVDIATFERVTSQKCGEPLCQQIRDCPILSTVTRRGGSVKFWIFPHAEALCM